MSMGNPFGVTEQAAPVALMTIGQLSRRTGMAVRSLREYADIGLIYTAGRSPGRYRLFDESALWCVEVIRGLRSLGLTVAEISEVASAYLARTDQPIGPHLAARLAGARARIELVQLPVSLPEVRAIQPAGFFDYFRRLSPGGRLPERGY
jgi:DNA-binding transcriptional MerR regulator